MQMKAVNYAGTVELDLKLQIVACGQFTTHRAHRAATMAAEHLVGLPQR